MFKAVTRSVLLTVALAFGPGSLLGALDVTNGLVGRWSFEGDLTDDTGSNAVGSNVNGVGFTNGIRGSALCPATNGATPRFANLGHGPSITNLSGQFTLAAWVFYRATNGTSGARSTILARMAPTMWYFDLVEPARSPRFIFMQSWGTQVTTGGTVGSIPTNTWVHLAVVSVGNAVILYTNGFPLVTNTNLTVTWVSLTNSGTVDVTVGARADNPQNFSFNGGAIDDVRIYNRGLSAAEMLVLGGGPACAITNLVSNGVVSTGFVFSGTASSPYGLSNTRLVVTNGAGTEVMNTAAVVDNFGLWSTTNGLSLPQGNYTAVLVATNSNSTGFASTPIPFSVVTYAALTVRSLGPTGNRLAGGLVFGPGGATTGGVLTNNHSGEVTFTAIQTGVPVILTNFSPVLLGLPAETTNFTMPAVDTLLVWTVGMTTTATNGPSMATSPFMTAGSTEVRVPVALRGLGHPRIQVVFRRLADGLKKTVFDGTQYSEMGDSAYLVLPRSALTSFLSPGAWVVETRVSSSTQGGASDRVTRQLFFYAP